MDLNKEQIDYIKESLEKQMSPYLIIIFGSAANEQMRADSDIDIAYLSDNEIQTYDLYMLAQEIAGGIGRDVHLVDLRQASTVLQSQIISRGKVVFDNDPLRRQEFFILVLKEYARLNEERAPILAKIKERGSIFAR